MGNTMNGELLETAIDIARNAGQILLKYMSPIHKDKHIEYKAEIDLVTDADFKSQEYIVNTLSTRFPGHGILAEEGIDAQAGCDCVWVIDPLDGTTNFAHGYPIFSISIGLLCEGQVTIGVVYDPCRDELFSAERFEGACLNGKEIKVSRIHELDKALLVTGFPYWTRDNPGKLFDMFREFTVTAQGVRRAGSASLDLCHVACGRLDGFWEAGLKSWDTAAGSLILTEAGGTLSKFNGTVFDIEFPEVLASNTLIHDQMMQILNRSIMTKDQALK